MEGRNPVSESAHPPAVRHAIAGDHVAAARPRVAGVALRDGHDLHSLTTLDEKLDRLADDASHVPWSVFGDTQRSLAEDARRRSGTGRA